MFGCRDENVKHMSVALTPVQDALARANRYRGESHNMDRKA
jgi:hypothetical protein